MDFHGNTDVLKICVVGMKSYPSLLSGVMLLLFVKVKNTLRCYSSYREFPGCSRLRFSTFCTPDFSAHTHTYIWSVCSTQDQDLHWCYNIVSLCWAKMNSINIISRHLTPLVSFLLLYLIAFMNVDMKIIKLFSTNNKFKQAAACPKLLCCSKSLLHEQHKLSLSSIAVLGEHLCQITTLNTLSTFLCHLWGILWQPPR